MEKDSEIKRRKKKKSDLIQFYISQSISSTAGQPPRELISFWSLPFPRGAISLCLLVFVQVFCVVTVTRGYFVPSNPKTNNGIVPSTRGLENRNWGDGNVWVGVLYHGLESVFGRRMGCLVLREIYKKLLLSVCGFKNGLCWGFWVLLTGKCFTLKSCEVQDIFFFYFW